MATAGATSPLDRMAEWFTEHSRVLHLLQLGPTLGFVVFFVFVPIASIFLWSFWTVQDGVIVPEFTLEAYARLFGIGFPEFMRDILFRTLRIAAAQTAVALVIGFAIAYYVGIRMRGNRLALPLLLLFAIPFLTSYLLRTLTWWLAFQDRGIINSLLQFFGFAQEPVPLLFSEFAVHVGLLATYLPFMIFPIYLAMSRIDFTILQASADLGAKPSQTLFRVVVPLVIPGMLIGCVFVFVGVLGDSVVPLLLGGPNNSLIAQQVEQAVSGERFNVAGAIATVILVLAFGLLVAWEKFFGLKRIGEI